MLGLKFLPEDESKAAMTETDEFAPENMIKQPESNNESEEKLVYQTQADAPPCFECGAIMVRNGACYKCLNCGSTSGCS